MKKVNFLMGVSCLAAMLCLSGCGSSEISSQDMSTSDVNKMEEETQPSTMPETTEPETQEESPVEEPPEEEILESFSLTFDSLYEQLRIACGGDDGLDLLEPLEVGEWYVEGVVIGGAYSDTHGTWVYCYEMPDNHEIIAMKIYCKGGADFRYKSAVEYILGLLSLDGRQILNSYVGEAFSQEGIIVRTITLEDTEEPSSLLAYVNSQDFSDDIYMGYSPYFSYSPCSDYLLVTYDDIASGACAHKDICIEAVVENPLVRRSDLEMSLWYPSGDTYVANDGYTESVHNFNEKPYGDVLASIENGTIVRLALHVNGDNTFGTTSLVDAMVVGEASLEEVHTAFKKSCPKMDYDGVMRNPDEYEDTYCQISGKIFQIISEGSYKAEYLISTNEGYVYAYWGAYEEVRGSRLLENDRVTIWGQFDGLKKYDTLISSKTVPELKIILIE